VVDIFFYLTLGKIIHFLHPNILNLNFFEVEILIIFVPIDLSAKFKNVTIDIVVSYKTISKALSECILESKTNILYFKNLA
jgi:hypothetical protein